jgi:hypothetical protein
VRLFSSVLRKDAKGRTYLITPAEKMDVAVDDAPFLRVKAALRSLRSRPTWGISSPGGPRAARCGLPCRSLAAA